MQDKLKNLLNEAKESVQKATSMQTLNELRVEYLGKKGKLTDILKGLGQLAADQRPKVGQWVNVLKTELQKLFDDRMKKVQAEALQKKVSAETLDVTLPGRGEHQGHWHPVTKVRTRVIELFQSLGFVVEEGPEIEDEFHNFDALNFKPHHPARTDMDTFYCEDGCLLRTHTSPVQIRVMKKQKPPIRIITPGRVYRRDSDHTHTPMFHQLEGLAVDETTTFADLKSVLQMFVNAFFESELSLRFRPSYFPFTEPSAEVDIECMLCHGKDAHCRICHGNGWLEVLGCGMVHPNVLRNVAIDPKKYSGFAFGIGIDRLAMLRYGVSDLRLFFENDLRFLNF